MQSQQITLPKNSQSQAEHFSAYTQNRTNQMDIGWQTSTRRRRDASGLVFSELGMNLRTWPKEANARQEHCKKRCG